MRSPTSSTGGKLLVAVQVFQVIVGAGLTVLTATGLLTPALLLTATFLLGVGTTLTIPAYQVLVQELVGREQMRSATALNGVAMNLARAVGPGNRRTAGRADRRGCGVRAERAELPGAGRGPAHHATDPVAAEHLLPERFVGAVIAGTRYVRHSPSVRRLLLRTLIFVVPGAALWALLPLVANTLLGLDALGYGVLLGALGVGAVSGAAVLPRVVARLSPSRLVLAASLVFGAATAVSAARPERRRGGGRARAGRFGLAVHARHDEREPVDVPARLGSGPRIVDLPNGFRGRPGACRDRLGGVRAVARPGADAAGGGRAARSSARPPLPAGRSGTSAGWIAIPPSSGRSRSWRSTPNRRTARCW